MQAIGKSSTYQLMELIKTFLNKGQVNVFASVYLTLFTLVLYALVIIIVVILRFVHDWLSNIFTICFYVDMVFPFVLLFS